MSTGAWVRRQRDRPIAESERRTAMAAIAVLLAATALLLTFTRAAAHRPSPRGTSIASSTAPAPRSSTPTRGASSDIAPSPAAARASRGFLAGYLPYIYGHAPANQIKDATQALARSLEAHPPRVSPELRSRAPRLLSLKAAPAPSGLIGVRALVTDGGLIDYRIGLLLAPRGARLLVSELEGGA